jgi:molybdopterin synthase sulfur carrier subunit
MPIKVLFFASLRERLGCGQVVVESPTTLSVLEVWQRSSGEDGLPDNVLVSVNQEYAGAETPVKPGDEVAFFPPVTGG